MYVAAVGDDRPHAKAEREEGVPQGNQHALGADLAEIGTQVEPHAVERPVERQPAENQHDQDQQ